jgi:hypothetical protein
VTRRTTAVVAILEAVRRRWLVSIMLRAIGSMTTRL